MKPEGTPILVVQETKTMGQRIRESAGWFIGMLVATRISVLLQEWRDDLLSFTIAEMVVIIGIPLLVFFLGRKGRKFHLYEEGVVWKRWVGREPFYRWDWARSFTSDDAKKQVILKRSRLSIRLVSRENYEELRRIVSQYVPSS